MGDRTFKAVALIGGACGALMSIAMALSMDTVYKDALGGTWRGAIAQDLHTFFGLHSSEKSLLVFTLFISIMLVLGAFGALMGLIFSVFVYKFLDMLQRK